jgi:GntR family transcriptional repressor for pyruvate dehydrogenase complex
MAASREISTSSKPGLREGPSAERQLTMQVVDHIRGLIERGVLKPGDRIPAEREFAKMLNISRASLRTGLGYMAAMGIVKVRHGVGAFVAEGPPELGSASLALLSAMHGFQPWQMFEARKILEGQLAALAAERGTPETFDAMAEELTDMFATLDDPQEYLIHDVRFHRLVAQASGNPILGALMESITGALYDERRHHVQLASDRRASAEMHREILRALRARDAAVARCTMEQHLQLAEAAQQKEKRPVADGAGGRRRAVADVRRKASAAGQPA